MKLGLLLLLVAFSCECKVFTRCKLAKELISSKIINKTFLASYVCLIEKVSNRDTSLVKQTSGKKKSYGLYQIPQKWCQEKKPGGDCNMACESLIDDDIINDTKCAKLIVDREGFKYWPTWTTRCKDDLKFITEEIYKCPELKKLLPIPENSDEDTAEPQKS